MAFVGIHSAPGGPAQFLLGADRYTPELEARLNAELGLDRSLPEQFGRWVLALGQGELGRSYFYRRPAGDVVGERWTATLLLAGSAFLLSTAAGITLGVLAALKRGWVDRVLSSGAIVFVATPSFWLAIVLIVVFSAWLGILPSSGMFSATGTAELPERLRHLALPLVAVAAPHAAALALYTRASVAGALVSEYARTARAKGAGPGRVAWRHALPNAAITIATIVALTLPHLIEGSVVVESVFAWPGIGQLTVLSVGRRDYPVLLVITLAVGIAVVLANLIADIAYRILDPRVELS